MKQVICRELPLEALEQKFNLGPDPRVLMVSESALEFGPINIWIEVGQMTMEEREAYLAVTFRVFATDESIPEEYEFVTTLLTRNNVAHHIYWTKEIPDRDK